nr:uncharacterized protein LOC113713288 isoform X1 [Coffea arabica]XP_027095032.1 uncharacterized protein LOC113715074 isoform X3 [Coffea arabica]
MLQKVPQNTFAYRVSTLLRSLVHLVWMLQLPQVLILLRLLLTPEIVLNHQPQFATSVALASGAAVAASAASTPSLNHKSIEKTLILDLSAFKYQRSSLRCKYARRLHQDYIDGVKIYLSSRIGSLMCFSSIRHLKM